ncbi:GNAT family N-acetyltransferase [Nocardia nova]|uniref:GNAT family N-acetyltransferase n=1 Tax=Nocardia nova TaxID=37330 RepID=UPI0025B164F7|nr:GNAT family N-acetyltransferase [Nocardia nova]
MPSVTVAADDPARADVRALAARHLAFARAHTPAEGVFALDQDGWADPLLRLVTARRDGLLLGMGAVRDLGGGHGELKSMHTVDAARGRGVGTAIVTHLLELARARGWVRVSLETGAGEAFRPARTLYERCGFVRCGAFGDYLDNGTSVFMTRAVGAADDAEAREQK